MALMTAAT